MCLCFPKQNSKCFFKELWKESVLSHWGPLGPQPRLNEAPEGRWIPASGLRDLAPSPVSVSLDSAPP